MIHEQRGRSARASIAAFNAHIVNGFPQKRHLLEAVWHRCPAMAADHQERTAVCEKRIGDSESLFALQGPIQHGDIEATLLHGLQC